MQKTEKAKIARIQRWGAIQRCGREVALPEGTREVPLLSARAFIQRDVALSPIWALKRRKERQREREERAEKKLNLR